MGLFSKGNCAICGAKMGMLERGHSVPESEEIICRICYDKAWVIGGPLQKNITVIGFKKLIEESKTSNLMLGAINKSGDDFAYLKIKNPYDFGNKYDYLAVDCKKVKLPNGRTERDIEATLARTGISEIGERVEIESIHVVEDRSIHPKRNNNLRYPTIDRDVDIYFADERKIEIWIWRYNTHLKSADEKVYDICAESIKKMTNSQVKKKKMAEISKSKSISEVNEIREWKKLLDEGIITQEEFSHKKKQLLGL